MSFYTTIMELPELVPSNIEGNEYLLASTLDTSYKISMDVIKTMASSDFVMGFYAKNITGYNIDRGIPVKLVGTDSDGSILIEPCSFNDYCVGLTSSNVDDNATVYVSITGKLENIDTSNFQVGELYLSSGVFSNQVNSDSQFVGYVLASSETGEIFISLSGKAPTSKQITFDKSVSNLTSNNLQDAIDEIAAYSSTNYIITTQRLIINDNKVILPYASKEDITMADIYDTINSIVITKYTCYVSNDRKELIFDSKDELNGKYTVISYLASL